MKLPYFAAAAWYYGMLSPEFQQRDLIDFLPEVEDFTINQLIPAFSKGGFISEELKHQMATKMAKYCGLSEKVGFKTT